MKNKPLLSVLLRNRFVSGDCRFIADVSMKTLSVFPPYLERGFIAQLVGNVVYLVHYVLNGMHLGCFGLSIRG